MAADRLIPMRANSNWGVDFSMIGDSEKPDNCDGEQKTSAYKNILRNELVGDSSEDSKNIKVETKIQSPFKKQKLFNYSPHKNKVKENFPSFSLSPVSARSQKLLSSPMKNCPKISKLPVKILEAPELQDDYYLNLLDWSSQNIICVGLGPCVNLWSDTTSEGHMLEDLASYGDYVTSISFSEKGEHLAVGTDKGLVQIWDIAAKKKVSIISGHTGRVGSLAWNNTTLFSGSKDRMILQWDIRKANNVAEQVLVAHRQEVCGLKWSPDKKYLASGGNDNKLFIWNLHSNEPIQTFSGHNAAVKAIAWSPHHHSVVASGGGTTDRCIKFWNTLTETQMQSIDTGSQVCNLAWSKHSLELVSTHGHSLNQILVWKYPNMSQRSRLTGHTHRVLYLAMSPDGNTIVTGAGSGDASLRFWNVFNKSKSVSETKSALNFFTSIR
ncbi:unnamed protein product [Meganyctiphanes norvegica]|uniref:CDC20/Fizzy WD40 domain-containing protein n=1 Tax=Meganyctiphanes norvegica TaxID=48144 RepID=A0AAV2Q5U5_MEGNR